MRCLRLSSALDSMQRAAVRGTKTTPLQSFLLSSESDRVSALDVVISKRCPDWSTSARTFGLLWIGCRLLLSMARTAGTLQSAVDYRLSWNYRFRESLNLQRAELHDLSPTKSSAVSRIPDSFGLWEYRQWTLHSQGLHEINWNPHRQTICLWFRWVTSLISATVNGYIRDYSFRAMWRYS